MQVLTDLASALLVGLVTGTVYGLIGLGVVLIFKAQRVINFAQAEFATTAAFVLYYLHSALRLPFEFTLLGRTYDHVPYGVAAFLAVSAAVLLAILVERLVIRPLRESPDVTVFVATAGVALLIIAVTLLLAGPNILIVEPVAKGAEEQMLNRGGFVSLLTPQRLVVLTVLVASALGLAAFFQRPLGRAVLAMSREPFAVRLAGISPQRISVLVWGISGLVAGLAGVASIPTTALTPGGFTRLALIPALTAVVIGGLTSLPGAFVGGIAIGVIEAVAAEFVPATVPAPGTIAVFVVLLLTLTVRPQGLLSREA